MRNPGLFTAALAMAALCALGSTAQQVATVSQKSRVFAPRAVTVAQGDTVVFVNDDGELLHHVYSDDPRFAFDIGEQPAGVQRPVRFTTRGVFDVRCGIHPRMLVQVTVR
ncbi:MAG: Copper binding protein, plastocyanin/azurin family [uncultured Acetobacteraceae bacterium]|uniref:Copper binding protein, plastocyanin/azurin family n=1 Tax=uncultured Acetobacteraceae bacterium TaxID=169975 RepID=A0A6J4HYH4_9PROT|nr:MAG: Copper binding protein, plastocyanin/azurin family [uncultured Acetobacteraceae bacterium]